MVRKPIFILSLDCESIWGFVRYPNLREAKLLRSDPRAGRGAVDFLLSILERYHIPATWAIVGHLFLDRCQCENGIPHKDMPRFTNDWFSCDPCSDIEKEPLYYGRDIVEKILASPVKHEIGLHSFSHVPFSECSKDVAEAEVKEGVMAAKKMGINVKSFVFPGNAIGHVDVLRDNGFEIYRGENLGDLRVSQTVVIRNINRIVNKIIARSAEPRWVDGIWEIPTSVFFSDPYLPCSLLPKIRFGILRAIRLKKIVHVFMHPQDLLVDDSLGEKLERLLAIVAQHRDRCRIQVMTMAELATYLNSEVGKPDDQQCSIEIR